MKEVDLYTSVVNKLQKKYPAYFENLFHDFTEEFNIETEDELKEMTKQFFYGWLFLDYLMVDGKRLLDFCTQALDLTRDEILILLPWRFLPLRFLPAFQLRTCGIQDKPFCLSGLKSVRNRKQHYLRQLPLHACQSKSG